MSFIKRCIAPLPHRAIREVLAPAYQPCRHFGACPQAKWQPRDGHIPRGFIGATGALEAVEVIMVSAEPGLPSLDRGDMDFITATTPDAMLAAAVQVSWNRRTDAGKADLYHRNFNWFCDELWPGMSFEERLQRLWMTNARLCSIDVEIGTTPQNPCAETFLSRQIALFPHAAVIGFGCKAQVALRRIGVAHIAAYALAPPGANHTLARPSWQRAIDAVRARRNFNAEDFRRI